MKRAAFAVLRLLASTPLSAALVAALAVLSVVGATLPQESSSGPAAVAHWQRAHPLVSTIAEPLGLFHTFSSWLFAIVLGALAVNLIACSIHRVVRLTRLRVAIGGPLLGSLALHAGLLVLLAGGVISVVCRVDGTVVATEGQELNLGEREGYVRLSRGTLVNELPLPHIRLTLERFRPVFRSQVPIQFASELTAWTQSDQSQGISVRVNRPGTVEGYALTQSDFGYSPSVTVTAPDGQPMIDAYVALRSSRAGDSAVHEDYIAMPGLEDRIMLRVYPDFVRRGRTYSSVSPEPRNPGLWARLLDSNGRTRYQALLEPGDEAKLGGYRVAFQDLRYWSAYRVVQDPGIVVVYVGFVVAVAGLVLRYAWLGQTGGALADGSQAYAGLAEDDQTRATTADSGTVGNGTEGER